MELGEAEQRKKARKSKRDLETQACLLPARFCWSVEEVGVVKVTQRYLETDGEVSAKIWCETKLKVDSGEATRLAREFSVSFPAPPLLCEPKADEP